MNTGAKRIYGADEWQALALNLCRGSYQRAIVEGRQRISGSDLKGKAARFSGRYSVSRDAILYRMKRARIPFTIERPKHGVHYIQFTERAV